MMLTAPIAQTQAPTIIPTVQFNPAANAPTLMRLKIEIFWNQTKKFDHD